MVQIDAYADNVVIICRNLCDGRSILGIRWYSTRNRIANY